MRVWITKWAFRQGILEAEAEDFGGGRILVVNGGFFYGKGRDWHDTLQSAQKRVEDMIEGRKAAASKQLRDLARLRTAALVVTKPDRVVRGRQEEDAK